MICRLESCCRIRSNSIISLSSSEITKVKTVTSHKLCGVQKKLVTKTIYENELPLSSDSVNTQAVSEQVTNGFEVLEVMLRTAF